MRSGTFSLDSRVIVQHRFRSEPLSGSFTVGLLTKPPTPEGTHSIELAAPGYSRQPVEFGPPAERVLNCARRSAKRVSFGLIGDACGDVRHAAIFDDNDEMLAYGLLQTYAGYAAPLEVAIEAGMVKLRF
jgi:hypothetical protein